MCADLGNVLDVVWKKQTAAPCVECDTIFEGRGDSLSPPPLSLCEHRTQSGRIHPRQPLYMKECGE